MSLKKLVHAKHAFSGLVMDRCEHKRKDAGWVQQQLQSLKLQTLVFDEETILANVAAPEPLVFLSQTQLSGLWGNALAENRILLGVTDSPQEKEVPVAAVRLNSKALSEGDRSRLASSGWSFTSIRKVMVGVPSDVLPVIGFGKSMSWFHGTNQFCSCCGARTAQHDGGFSRQCTNASCSERTFPRINPCAIMLVLDGRGNCLLGKGKGRPWFSTLAGFCSHGESLEETVAREVHEESGVIVSHVTYHSSQSWPFPAQLMVGFHAVADCDGTAITVDPNEMDDVKWFSKDEMRRVIRDGSSETIMIPPAYSIAHQLIRAWVDQEVDDRGCRCRDATLTSCL